MSETLKEVIQDVWKDKTISAPAKVFWLSVGILSVPFSLMSPSFVKAVSILGVLAFLLWVTFFKATGATVFVMMMVTVWYAGFWIRVLYNRYMWRAVRRKDF
jgi:hypothetical protein